MEIIKIIEFDIKEATHGQITRLRNICFPETKVERSYYKQLPHFRYLAFENDLLIGHMGVDYRVISVGNCIFKIFGVIDLCVIPTHRNQGIATKILNLLSELAKEKYIDFIFLVADNKKVYLKNGFEVVSNYCSWLRIDEHKNYGVAFEIIEDEFMIKQIGIKTWCNEPIDLLGYMF